MLQTIDVGVQSVEAYSPFVGEEKVSELRRLAADLRGAKVAHINATPYGGGVSELLRSIVPLLRNLGIQADWKVISGDDRFFNMTKAFHNALQGAKYDFPRQDRETYLMHNAHNARLLEEPYDYIIIHDPQAAALRHFHGRNGARWIWRCHIDSSEPNPDVWGFLRAFLEDYDALVFTMGQFVPPGLPEKTAALIPPAIDPLSPKNMPLPQEICHRVIDWVGVELGRPLITQVSRFDPWKDPLGVIKAYRLVREEVPELQLALLGSMALDDPQGWEIYREILEESKADEGVHVFTNLTGVSNVEVNAFQCCSNVVVQKSIREGFGLVVSETLWKGTPVVAGKAGGIPMQLPEGKGGYLVSSIEECAERVLHLLKHPEEAKELGKRGREHVKEHFLLPRLLRDELALLHSLT